MIILYYRTYILFKLFLLLPLLFVEIDIVSSIGGIYSAVLIIEVYSSYNPLKFNQL